MEIVDLILTGVIIFLAGAAQSAVGFGYALFATPLLVWIGIPLPNVITLVLTCSMIQAIVGARKLHAAVPWRLSLTATAIGLASVIIGLLLLKRLAALNTDHIRAVIGGILCLLVAIQFLWRPHPVKAMHWGWGGLAFIGSGFLAGLCGMGGPPLVLWSMAHDWSTQKTRGFLFAVFATSIPVHIVLLGLTFGTSILWNVAIGLAFLPLVFLGAAIGLPIGNRMAKDKLRRIAYAILLVIGTSAVVPAILAQLH
jgi:uncharacterized membrane protein YfcA